MSFEEYIGKQVAENAEDLALTDVDIVEDDGNMVNVFFVPEEFEEEPGKRLKTGVLIAYDDDRTVTDIVSVAHVFRADGPAEEIDPEMCEDEELVKATLEKLIW